MFDVSRFMCCECSLSVVVWMLNRLFFIDELFILVFCLCCVFVIVMIVLNVGKVGFFVWEVDW